MRRANARARLDSRGAAKPLTKGRAHRPCLKRRAEGTIDLIFARRIVTFMAETGPLPGSGRVIAPRAWSGPGRTRPGHFKQSPATEATTATRALSSNGTENTHKSRYGSHFVIATNPGFLQREHPRWPPWCADRPISYKALDKTTATKTQPRYVDGRGGRPSTC